MANQDLTVVTSLSANAPDAQEADDAVADALVLAARQLMVSFGIRRLRMDDVAKEAGFGRATLYRRFATRDELVWAVISREVSISLQTIERALMGLPTMRARLVEGFAATIETVRDHPLLSRLLHIEADLLLPHLTLSGGPALDLGRQHLRRLMQHGQQGGELGPVDLDVAADLFVRLAHSLLLTDGGPIPVDDPVALRAFADDYLVRPLLHLSVLQRERS